MVDRGRARDCTDIQQNAHSGLEYVSKGVEEPSVGVDFSLIFLLEAEDHLDGDCWTFVLPVVVRLQIELE